MTACSYTPSQIDEMEMLDIISLFKFWKDFPPAHESLAKGYTILCQFLGIKAEKGGDDKKKTVNPNDPSGIGRMILAHPNGFVREDRG